jgi:protocatechuate 3,4-dioxygenase beta subunit
MRPGHLHTMFTAPGYATLVTHLFVRGDVYLDSDAVFGVKDSLVVDFKKSGSGEWSAHYDFVLRPSSGGQV